MSERGPAFDQATEACERARAWRDWIIDHPGRTVPVEVYRSQIMDAQHQVQEAHKDMMEAQG